MLARRWLIPLIFALTASRPAFAQSVALTEAPLVDGCVRNEITMELDGKITVQQGGKNVSFPHKASAKHVYLERYLEAKDAVAEKAARHYQTAEGTITFNDQPARRSLRPERAFLVTQRVKDQLVTFSLKGPLSREEMELTEHFDTLAVAALAPGKTVNVGDSWKLATAAAVLLCDLDGLTEHDLTCKLDAVKDGKATVKITGSASGIDMGALVKLLVNASYDFDVTAQRVVAVEWKQSEQRQQGPVSPALSADLTIRLTRTPIEEPTELNKIALVPIPAGPEVPANLAGLLYKDGKGRYEFQHARDWHVVSPDDSDQLVLRLMERGDFVAQVTVTAWKKIDAKDVIAVEEFAELMSKTPGWEETTRIQATAVDEKGFHKVYRVTGTGKLDGVEAWQSFYLLVSPQGQQVIVTFTSPPTRGPGFQERGLDLALIRTFVFPTAEEK